MDAPDTRAITIVDIPLIRRLSNRGTVLDSERGLTRDARGANSALLSSILFPRGLYTLVAKNDQQQVVGQFRYNSDDTCAHIVYLAPSLEDEADNTILLHILDAMTQEAGKHGAHALLAEVEPSNSLFETFRNARFAPYTRQMIWRHDPIHIKREDCDLKLVEVGEDDQISIASLMGNIVPKMLQQFAVPFADMRGLIYRQAERVVAYVAYSEGENGVYILPFIDTDAVPDARNIIKATIAQTSRARRVPVYVCVRSYQEWLSETLLNIEFEPWIEQAVMVKHIAAGVRHPGFRRVSLTHTEVAKPAVPALCSVPAYHDEELT
ncbi:hypothetical protein G4Y79_07510 [Phototrophicus methaneseepsis]|uniref:N-acetyltransferase domain-containing protein n=1 Tax=Phototrophicus methaneseepsis TaxID=2710758 RepID=A0A7S8IF04_9CHLR|nr:hypothetical protein [Phototrophicus methaneseepsis]QPC84210.1 hypothetical protein G4Y79_07510 [Phototrophicus methaneseepsis]